MSMTNSMTLSSDQDEDVKPGQEQVNHRNGVIGTPNSAGEDRTGGYYVASITEEGAQLLSELERERSCIDPEENPHLYRLVMQEIKRLVTAPSAEFCQDIDLYHDTPITLNVKCFPPTKIHPAFNYAGRILGPKGTYLKALMRETKTKMVVLGHGVMKDKDRETELKLGGDPKYMHLNEDMHISITVTAPASEAYERISYAMSCLKRQTLSDNRELQTLPWLLALRLPTEGGATAPLPVGYLPPPPGADLVPTPYEHISPPPPKRRPVHVPPYAEHEHPTRYFERSPYPPPIPRDPAREYYEEYGRVSRVPRPPPPPHIGYARPPNSFAVASTAEKLRESANRAAALAYTRSKPKSEGSGSADIYDYEHKTDYHSHPAAELQPRAPWSGNEPRMRPLLNRYVPYRKM